MADQPDIIISLFADWLGIVKSQLVAAGYKPAPDNEPLRVAIQYFNVQLRQIDALPRTVEVAADFACTSDLRPVVDEIIRKTSAGEALTPHLSRLLLDADFNDPLLNDWGLHHLHLGKKVESDGFIERSGPLLFVMVRDLKLYVVGVRPHQGAWTDESLLETVAANWPHLLAPYEAKGIHPSGEPVSPKDRAALRKAGVLTPTQLSNGKLYFPPGGGINTAGSNIRTVVRYDQIVKQLRQIEQDFRENLATKSALLPPGKQFGSPPTFRLGFDGQGRFLVYEATANVAFQC